MYASHYKLVYACYAFLALGFMVIRNCCALLMYTHLAASQLRCVQHRHLFHHLYSCCKHNKQRRCIPLSISITNSNVFTNHHKRTVWHNVAITYLLNLRQRWILMSVQAFFIWFMLLHLIFSCIILLFNFISLLLFFGNLRVFTSRHLWNVLSTRHYANCQCAN